MIDNRGETAISVACRLKKTRSLSVILSNHKTLDLETICQCFTTIINVLKESSHLGQISALIKLIIKCVEAQIALENIEKISFSMHIDFRKEVEALK